MKETGRESSEKLNSLGVRVLKWFLGAAAVWFLGLAAGAFFHWAHGFNPPIPDFTAVDFNQWIGYNLMFFTGGMMLKFFLKDLEASEE